MIKKRSLLKFILLLTLLQPNISHAIAKDYLSDNEAKAISSYQKSSHFLKSVSISEIQTMMANKKIFYLYTGRATCPHCRRFMPRLIKATQESKIPIYYLNSESMSLNLDLKTFRNHYHITTVPNLSRFQSNYLTKTLEKPSLVSKEDIIIFLTQ
ncbi:bacteriocin transporter [Streptococcus dysgalactiae subsp. dysgalactiae]|uniref:Bacteriocin transporter n=1 Tax=Streptococcus dysgalactiae subsp. dysgalactiae TaxID=99822 RepID=A0A9X7SEW7_STRDY|nr:bacteriocin transporter [Streptococcus dysgalactiae subsp. dysgalactiae]QGG98274.1 bacteriocin transporter [Streptococcus dysgalactiae subsp. dysgalactiae]QGH02698.1 bacteriocin transporter [Streptococcus dysgalactiae subsp. dysgalactiae]